MLKIYRRKKEELEDLKQYLTKLEEDLYNRIKHMNSINNEKLIDHPEYIKNILERQKKERKKKSGRPSET